MVQVCFNQSIAEKTDSPVSSQALNKENSENSIEVESNIVESENTSNISEISKKEPSIKESSNLFENSGSGCIQVHACSCVTSTKYEGNTIEDTLRKHIKNYMNSSKHRATLMNADFSILCSRQMRYQLNQ